MPRPCRPSLNDCVRRPAVRAYGPANDAPYVAGSQGRNKADGPTNDAAQGTSEVMIADG